MDTHSWFVGSADVKKARFTKCAFLNRYMRFLHTPLLRWKNGPPEMSRSLLLDLSCPCNTSVGFLLGDVLLSRCHGRLYARWEVLTLFFLVLVTTLHRGSTHGMGSLGFRWSCADHVGGSWLAAKTAPAFIRKSRCRSQESRSWC